MNLTEILTKQHENTPRVFALKTFHVSCFCQDTGPVEGHKYVPLANDPESHWPSAKSCRALVKENHLDWQGDCLLESYIRISSNKQTNLKFK